MLIFSPLPAARPGTIAQVRREAEALAKALADPATMRSVLATGGFNRLLNAGGECPVAIMIELRDGVLSIRAAETWPELMAEAD